MKALVGTSIIIIKEKAPYCPYLHIGRSDAGELLEVVGQRARGQEGREGGARAGRHVAHRRVDDVHRHREYHRRVVLRRDAVQGLQIPQLKMAVR